MQLFLVLTLFSLVRASHDWSHHRQLRRTPFLPSSIPVIPALSLPTSTSIIPFTSFSFSSFSSSVPQSTLVSPSTRPPSPSITSSTSTSSVTFTSLSLSSSASSTSAVTSTLFVSSAPVDVGQPSSSSSSVAITSINGAGAPTQDSSSSTVALTSTVAIPSSTTTHASSSGFFANTGAVAGTFTVVGLVSIASVIAVVFLIARHRHSRSYQEDSEYLDKSPDLSADPPIAHITSLDDGSTSDHAHYSAPPMVPATLPAAYYPDHPYAFHPQAFSSEVHPPPRSRGRPSPHPVTSTQNYAAQRVYSPEDYDIAQPPQPSRADANMPNPYQFTDVELDSTPVHPPQTPLPNALRPSVNSAPSAPKQWASTRFSVDSFYAGIAADTSPSSGRAL